MLYSTRPTRAPQRSAATPAEPAPRRKATTIMVLMLIPIKRAAIAFSAVARIEIPVWVLVTNQVSATISTMAVTIVTRLTRLICTPTRQQDLARQWLRCRKRPRLRPEGEQGAILQRDRDAKGGEEQASRRGRRAAAGRQCAR